MTYQSSWVKIGIVLSLVSIAGPVIAQPAQNTQAKNAATFTLLTWPEAGSFFDADTITRLTHAWHENHIRTYTERDIHFNSPKDNSLTKFMRIIQTNQPECLEGDPDFIEREINDKRGVRLYIPILRQFPSDTSKQAQYGEIVFGDRSIPWTGLLGVVHPFYGIGGRVQIDYWRSQKNVDPEWTGFDSSQEVLSHLFVGSIQAAALPQGALDAFLAQRNRLDLEERVTRIQITEQKPLPAIYLREDQYNNPFRRTVISETWLRNRFPTKLDPVYGLWP